MKVCICGGGSIGHVLAGVLSSQGNQVNVLTGHPQNWSKKLTIFLPDSSDTLSGILNEVSSVPEDVIPGMDYVLLCLPGFLIPDCLLNITPFLSPFTIIGSTVSSNGFFWMAKSIIPEKNFYFGLQRVPYIARVLEYGHSATIKGYKPLLKAGCSLNSDKEKIKEDLTRFFSTPVKILDSIWPAALTNSNPILHTARLYSLFKDYSQGVIYPEEPLFYENCNKESSEMLIACDEEFQTIIKELPFDHNEIPPLLSYYESYDTESLTQKLKSIEAFKGIRLKMKKVNGGYIPDWKNRYFSEDIPFGLLIIKGISREFGITTPNIDIIIRWAQIRMGKDYLDKNNELNGKDIKNTGVHFNFVQNFNDFI